MNIESYVTEFVSMSEGVLYKLVSGLEVENLQTFTVYTEINIQV